MVLAHRTHTDILSNRQEIKSVAFTSCQPGEGKSTIALSLARQQAHCGRRVVLIDADFAMSRLAGNTGLSVDTPGLTEVLVGKLAIEDVVKKDSRSPLDIILPGQTPIDHAALATSSAIENIVARLRDRYELVVIDTQPVLATAHAYQFANAADISLMVWGRTPRREVVYALHQLTFLGGNVNALVLSMVDVAKSWLYGYGDSRYYSGRATRYYAKAATRS